MKIPNASKQHNSKTVRISVHHLFEIMHALITEVILSDNLVTKIKAMSQKKWVQYHTPELNSRTSEKKVHHLVEIMHALIKKMIPSDYILITIIKRTAEKSQTKNLAFAFETVKVSITRFICDCSHLW